MFSASDEQHCATARAGSLSFNMATWRDGLSDLEREMLVHSESIGLSPYARTPAKRPKRSVDEEDVPALPDPSPDPDAWRLMNTAW